MTSVQSAGNTGVHEVIRVLFGLVDAVSRATNADAICEHAVAALISSIRPDRAGVLVFAADGVMRFCASHGLSDAYRAAVEGHSPWPREAANPQPVLVPDALGDMTLAPFHSLFETEGLGALAFIPLVADGRLLGKFMLYYNTPHEFTDEETQFAQTIAHHVAFGLQRLTREHESAALKDQLAAELTAVTRLHEISQGFLERGRMDDVLADILAAAIEITGAAHGTVQIRDVATGELRLVAHRGFQQEFLDFFRQVGLGDTAACAHALESGQRIVVRDVFTDPIFAEPGVQRVMRRAGVRAVISTPLLARTREVLGIISTHFEQPHEPSERELRSLDLVARQAADLVEHAQAGRRRDEALAAESSARAEAEAANRAKDEFIAMVSHELRTPLTAMIGWTKMLRTGQLDPKGSAHALEVIERNLRQQTQILTDLLDVARIVSGKLTLDGQLLEVAPIIEMAVDVVRPTAEAKALTLTTMLDPFAGTVYGDATRLQQVFWNLISNAVKFTPTGGKIDVRLERARGHARVSVTDTGRGIAPEFLPHLFERFQQAETGLARHHGGLGLGLAIARHLVELHGGRIDAFSAGEGQGATFTVDLPLTSADVGTAALDRSRRRRKAPRLANVRVLIVDDHEDTVDFMSAALTEYGAHVRGATSVQEALGVLPDHRPQVLISDLSMPGEDGFSLMRRINAEGLKLTAIALTAHARTQDRERALASGFQMYLSKPVEPSRVGYIIEALVNVEGRALSY
jgi:signal transduction histidine kinase/ActR/RegA family two-component response regulator